MATYSELVTLINAYINENGVQAITGRILNGVLNEMVDQLGSGFPIMGSAVPTDNPGTPDSPRAWFASEPGIYTNFGGIVIEEGELALLIYDNGWYKTDIGQGGDPNAVQYIEQSLEDNEKEQARANIGAIGSIPAEPTVEQIALYPTVNYTAQSLTSAQKAQARLNIGAGTSDFSGDYRDLSNKPTIPTVPETSTNINADRYNNDKVAGTKAVYEEVHPKVETVRYSWGMSPNVMYNLGELTGNVVFLFATPDDNTIVNHYYFCFDVGNTVPTITWPVEITDWFGMAAPTIVAGHHYEVSVINGVAAYLEV